MASKISGIEGYAETADVLVQRYENVAFADTHRAILHLLPTPPALVIDVGAGTGRDAAALAALGHSVIAVEPTAELRAHGRRLHPSPAITWIDDSLPDLAALKERGGHFDLLMVTAVFMHLNADQRRHAMPRLCQLLRSGGTMALSLRHGPVPAGRRMFDVSADETIALAVEHGMESVHRSQRASMTRSPGVTWDILAFRKH